MKVSSVVVAVMLAGCLMIVPAHGQGTFACSTSERIGGRVVKEGDSERRVIELKPDREVRLETRQGGTAGWRFDFYKPGRTVQVYVRSGVVTQVCRVRD